MEPCERKCVGHYTIPKLNDDQVHFCKDSGCEPVAVKKIDEWCFRESKGDTIFREEYYTVEVCSSCGGDVGVWSTATDTEVYCDYELQEINE